MQPSPAPLGAHRRARQSRDLTHEGGGFFSAEDADSVPPELASDSRARRSEGAFYIWSADEFDSLKGSDAQVVALRFGIEPSGNAPHDPQGEFGSKNLLYIARSMEEVAAATGRTVEEVCDVLGRARRRLFEARKARSRPRLDDKVLVSWNGLMIAALARAAPTLGVHVGDDAAARSLVSRGACRHDRGIGGVECFLDGLPQRTAFVGDGVERHRKAILSRLPTAIFPRRSRYLAGTLGLLAEPLLAAGQGVPPSELRPLYLRDAHIRGGQR